MQERVNDTFKQSYKATFMQLQQKQLSSGRLCSPTAINLRTSNPQPDLGSPPFMQQLSLPRHSPAVLNNSSPDLHSPHHSSDVELSLCVHQQVYSGQNPPPSKLVADNSVASLIVDLGEIHLDSKSKSHFESRHSGGGEQQYES